jgi:hypothetical protein
VQISSQQFSFKLPGKIWKVVTPINAKKLVVEVRDEPNMKVSFYEIDLDSKTKKLLSIDKSDWWASLLQSNYPYVLIEKYLDPQDPVNKELIIYDLQKSEVVQVLSGFQFMNWTTDGILGYQSGKSNQPRVHQLSMPHFKTSSITYPLQFDQGTPGHHTVAEFLEKDVQKFLSVEYLEYQNYIIISYYDRLGTKFARKLRVLQDDDELCDIILDEQVEGFAAGGFFVKDQTLIFVVKSQYLNGIELGK